LPYNLTDNQNVVFCCIGDVDLKQDDEFDDDEDDSVEHVNSARS